MSTGCKLSIITINYNNADGLRNTLNSVMLQEKVFFEHVIVDGASTDDSVKIIKDYITSINNKKAYKNIQVRWVSETDSGIYNAMNKGIKMAEGEYLLFLNSGDVLVNSRVVSEFCLGSYSSEIISGIQQMSSGVFVYPPKEENLTYSYFYDNTLMHQATFISRNAFEKYGMYDESYRIVSDWEWFFKVIIIHTASYEIIDLVVSMFDETGISRSKELDTKHDLERFRVRNSVLPRLFYDYNELKRLQGVEKEFTFLLNGKLGWIVRVFLFLKKIVNNK